MAADPRLCSDGRPCPWSIAVKELRPPGRAHMRIRPRHGRCCRVHGRRSPGPARGRARNAREMGGRRGRRVRRPPQPHGGERVQAEDSESLLPSNPRHRREPCPGRFWRFSADEPPRAGRPQQAPGAAPVHSRDGRVGRLQDCGSPLRSQGARRRRSERCCASLSTPRCRSVLSP